MPGALIVLIRRLVNRLGAGQMRRLTQGQRLLFIFLPGLLATVLAAFLLVPTGLPRWLVIIVGGVPLAVAFALLDIQDRLATGDTEAEVQAPGR